MTWVFVRDGERLQLEMRRAASEGYEVALTYPGGDIRTELASDPADLLERCASLVRELQEEGWEPVLDIIR